MNKQVIKIAEDIIKESVEKTVPATIKLTLETPSLDKFQETVRQVPGFSDFGDPPLMSLNVMINPKITNERKFRDDLAKKRIDALHLDVMRG